ncbi:MAG: hypothetical protein II336_18565 [Loktanella sp.]|nr:hypothetical protein [Loktanella sp.]
MLDLMTRIRRLQRPSLLARAARFGADDYRRETYLPRLLKTDVLPRPAAAIMTLLAIEADLDRRRIAGDAPYSPGRHVEFLIAIAGEARLLQAIRVHAV